ncbi:MAG: hypothetical protein M1818_007784 [Claussenomyces sp. TS43310]|nr:MAG: hypothetical protein M1818_007784 [Claussenomyces sp. TS43310]
MQFFSPITILAALSIGSSVFAAPAPSVKGRQVTTPVGAVNNAISILQGTITTDAATLTSLVANTTHDVSAQITIAAAVEANVNAIAAALATATTAIIGATTNAVTALTAGDILLLIQDIGTVESLIMNLQTTFGSVLSSLVAETETAIKAEITAAENLIQPFVTPLETYAGAVTGTATDGGTLFVPVLKASVGALSSIVSTSIASLGISS